MDRSTVLVKLSKLYAMTCSPSNPNEAESAEEKFWNIAATHGLSASDLLTNENPERELVQSILHEMNEITAKTSSLVRHAVEEDKRQSDRFMEWSRKRQLEGNAEPVEVPSIPFDLTDALRAAREAQEMARSYHIGDKELGVDQDTLESFSRLLVIINHQDKFEMLLNGMLTDLEAIYYSLNKDAKLS